MKHTSWIDGPLKVWTHRHLNLLVVFLSDLQQIIYFSSATYSTQIWSAHFLTIITNFIAIIRLSSTSHIIVKIPPMKNKALSVLCIRYKHKLLHFLIWKQSIIHFTYGKNISMVQNSVFERYIWRRQRTKQNQP